jgi:hypothetical protein
MLSRVAGAECAPKPGWAVTRLADIAPAFTIIKVVTSMIQARRLEPRRHRAENLIAATWWRRTGRQGAGSHCTRRRGL